MSEDTTKSEHTTLSKEDRKAIYDEVSEEIKKQINSWTDLYASIRGQVTLYFAHPCRSSADRAAAMMLAFLAALEELPEEGDAQVIAERINYLLIMEPERLGLSMDTNDDGSDTPSLVESLAETLARVAALGRLIEEERTTSEDISDTRTLH